MSISDETAKQMLKSIELGGAADEANREVNIVLGSSNNLDVIITRSGGLPKIRKDAESKFQLILSTPVPLKALSPFEIRCCLCKRVISYPAWYWSKKYVVNHFHYFICFDSASNTKPTTKCFKRS